MADPNVVTGPNSLPYDILGFPNYNTSPAVAPLISTEIVKKSFPSMINYLLPKGDASLFGLSSRMKEETALQIEHGFFAKIMIFPSFTVNGAIADTTTTSVTVYDSSQVIPNGLYKRVGTTTGGSGALTPSTTYASEIVLVTAVASGTAITVTRGIGSTAANIAGDSTFVHIGNAFADASTRPNSFLTREIRVVNYTQIFRNAWALSGTVAAIQNLLGDTNLSKSKIECSQYHAMDIEKSLFFGVRSNTAGVAGSSNAFRTMNGIISQISDGQAASLFLPGQVSSSNITVANSSKNGTPTAGDLSIDDLENWLDQTWNMSYDPASGMERVVFCGLTAHKVFNRLARLNTTYYIQNGVTEWGLQFSRIKFARGTVVLIEHPLFNTNLQWSRMAVAVDLPSISLAYMVGRKTKAEEYNQNGTAIDSAIDAAGGSLLTELTILCKNPAGCGIMLNIQKALSADTLVEH
jgi:hypothetical protein